MWFWWFCDSQFIFLRFKSLAFFVDFFLDEQFRLLLRSVKHLFFKGSRSPRVCYFLGHVGSLLCRLSFIALQTSVSFTSASVVNIPNCGVARRALFLPRISSRVWVCITVGNNYSVPLYFEGVVSLHIQGGSAIHTWMNRSLDSFASLRWLNTKFLSRVGDKLDDLPHILILVTTEGLYCLSPLSLRNTEDLRMLCFPILLNTKGCRSDVDSCSLSNTYDFELDVAY